MDRGSSYPHLTIAASSGDDDGVGVLSPEEDVSYNKVCSSYDRINIDDVF